MRRKRLWIGSFSFFSVILRGGGGVGDAEKCCLNFLRSLVSCIKIIIIRLELSEEAEAAPGGFRFFPL
ncbi:hypothetical protein HMPREF7215_1041 [Pyramidobacter piscolens W5455]|uniref:Secreted protein n=1 Tax=Pyramidobacter piscolens W5455 TaxID=352165 RepID=A0ABM9ZS59_9BACT|nr:hypothetical protein HMPREF7215_1041 [Pyramidobacter piscolens W5455]